MVKNFPEYWSAPSKLLSLQNNCGVMAAWGVLRHFGKRVSSDRLIESCCHSRTKGVFAIVLAVAIREYGLSVSFHTAPDPAPHRLEKRYYRIAEDLGIPIERPISLPRLLALTGDSLVPIVLYNEENSAHFSPLLGQEAGRLNLPYSTESVVSNAKFLRNWNAPEIYRQAIVVSK